MTSIRFVSFLAILAFLTTLSTTMARPHSQLFRRQLVADAIELVTKGLSHAVPVADDALAGGARLVGSADEVGAIASAAGVSGSADQVANGVGSLAADGSSAASRAPGVMAIPNPADEAASKMAFDASHGASTSGETVGSTARKAEPWSMTKKVVVGGGAVAAGGGLLYGGNAYLQSRKSTAPPMSDPTSVSASSTPPTESLSQLLPPPPPQHSRQTQAFAPSAMPYYPSDPLATASSSFGPATAPSTPTLPNQTQESTMSTMDIAPLDPSSKTGSANYLPTLPVPGTSSQSQVSLMSAMVSSPSDTLVAAPSDKSLSHASQLQGLTM